jgi:hypothetical protein
MPEQKLNREHSTIQYSGMSFERAITRRRDRFDALERAGFRVDRYGDLSNVLYVRLGAVTTLFNLEFGSSY